MGNILNTIPKYLRPFLDHGINLDYEGRDQALGDCFCGKEQHFYVNNDPKTPTKNGYWDCKVCGARGGAYAFLQEIWNASEEGTEVGSYKDLAKSKNLLEYETLIEDGLRLGIFSSEWNLPGYNGELKICQLYRYLYQDNRFCWLPTAGLEEENRSGFFISGGFDPEKPEIWVMEGYWDAACMREVASRIMLDDEGNYSITGNYSSSLASQINFLAVPGCQIFKEKWGSLFGDKIVTFFYDNDYEKGPTALEAMKRAVGILSRADIKPLEVRYLYWGPDGADKSLKHGYDVRDFLTNSGGEGDGKDTPSSLDERGTSSYTYRVARLEKLLKRIRPSPKGWVKGARKSGSVALELLECKTWKELVNSWKPAMKWPESGEGLDYALSVMLACVTSTPFIDTQTWIRVLGPPSCGKSTLAEAFSANPKYVFSKSTLTGFHSGWGGEEEDKGLIPHIKGKTFIVKDADPILKAPNRSQILAEARDIYDGTTRVYYRTGKMLDHQGIRTTMIWCGTNALHELDTSELGERFLDCVIMDEINPEVEDEIAWRAVNKANNALNHLADGTVESNYSPELAKAMQMTGGYINYLREEAPSLIESIDVSDEVKRYCMALGKLISYTRSKPGFGSEVKPIKELSARLIEQFMRLTKCLAAVLNKKEVDKEVLARIRKVALDTAAGWNMVIIDRIHKRDLDYEKARDDFDDNTEWTGAIIDEVAHWINLTTAKARDRLRFLDDIRVLETFNKVRRGDRKVKAHYRLTARFAKLWDEVMAFGKTKETREELAEQEMEELEETEVSDE